MSSKIPFPKRASLKENKKSGGHILTLKIDQEFIDSLKEKLDSTKLDEEGLLELTVFFKEVERQGKRGKFMSVQSSLVVNEVYNAEKAKPIESELKSTASSLRSKVLGK